MSRVAIGCLAPPVPLSGTITELLQATLLADSGLSILVLPQGALAGDAPKGTQLSTLCAPLAHWAQAAKVFVAGAEFVDGELWGFVVSNEGLLALRQPSLTRGQGPAQVTVLDSPYGKLACLPGDDPCFPEYVRLAMFRGAEILLNPCAERADERADARRKSRSARCWENHAVLAAASAATVLGPGLAEIWDFNGELLAAGSNGLTTARVDMQSLRVRRSEPWVNFPASLRTALYAPYYERGAVQAPTASANSYDVLLLQGHQVFVTDEATRDATIQGNLDRSLGLARVFAMRPNTRLVVLPEFFAQGSAFGMTIEWWERMAIRVGGAETRQLGDFARDCKVYLCCAILEFDPDWPRRYFNTSLIFAPDGQVILRYRKLQCADLNGLLNVTTPGNIYSAYAAKYGEHAFVPVVDTEIGRLGTLICFDSNWPELWRSLALQGAEVICNPTSHIHSERRAAWYRAKQAHAAENLVYVASANVGSEQLAPGAPITQMNRGHSALIDYCGRLVSCADGGGVVPLVGRIDLGALRRARADAAQNDLARFRPQAVAAAYREFSGFPLDCFAERPMESAAEGPALVAQQIEKLTRAGILKAPAA